MDSSCVIVSGAVVPVCMYCMLFALYSILVMTHTCSFVEMAGTVSALLYAAFTKCHLDGLNSTTCIYSYGLNSLSERIFYRDISKKWLISRYLAKVIF